eukprot:CAMPEP_0113451630 /NCGR_PEP_ID=MMETSP0014_2-20120614/6435_1 /TAXON_ID=2857 /ORGANISM="Nitzschia sp." /LENGTH=166 /DNA_ID=CAMNT_0000342987 /DNA_START=146 /DNA_END=646 /DNA_ORIENTATION=- /assembly_acc=CAM_ASM_000159
MGSKSSKTRSTNKDYSNSPAKNDSRSVTYNSKKCINIHTYLATSPSSPSSATAAAPRNSSNRTENKSNIETMYELKKRRPGCTGMFWRSDPRPITQATVKLASNANWPRDGAMLKGTVITVPKYKKWLMVEEVKQKNQDEWVKAPAGAFMPFEYSNHYYLDEVPRT